MITQRLSDTHNHRIRRPYPVVSESKERNKLFPEHALVINLKRSEERLQTFNENNAFNGTTEVIEAIDGMELDSVYGMGAGDLATLKSHRKALQYAKDKGWECVIIFEDDIRFVTDFNEKLKQAMSELPETWDMLYLGGADRKIAVPYSKNLKSNACCWGGYAIVFKNTTYDYFIKLFEKETRSCDDQYSLNSDKFNVFRTVGNYCIHIGKVSDRTIVNHTRR